jgi:hypothetical protein
VLSLTHLQFQVNDNSMAKHYYRTNVPLPIMIIWWVFIGICVLLYSGYDALFKAPERHEQEQRQEQWDKDHFNGWRLEQRSYASDDDIRHGLLFDKFDKVECTAKGYPGYPTCPSQQFYVDGKPQSQVQSDSTNSRTPK